MSVTIDRITDASQLTSLRTAWNDLARRTPGVQFFQSYDWLDTYWRYFGGAQQMNVLLVSEDSQLLGVFPFVIRSEQRRIGTVRVLTFPLDDWGSLYGPITPCGDRTIPAVVNYLRQSRKSWDVLSWRWLAPDDPVTSLILQQMQALGLRVLRSVRATTARIKLPETFDEYLASRTRKFRTNLRRWQRRCVELGTLRYQKFRPVADSSARPEPRWDLYNTCEDLAAISWQGSSTTGTTLSHQSMRPFLREVHQAAVALGAADVNLLYLDERPVAFEYGYWWQGYKFSLRCGYDSRFHRAGIGNLMWLETIKASLAAGDHTFDMGPGSLEYKRHYLTETVDCQTLDYYRPLVPKAQAIALKQLIQNWWNSPSPA